MNKFMITALGKDRPGMISLVSNILYEQDCNLENVNQMILQKQFAGFFIDQSPDKALIDALPRALAQTQRVCASVNVATARAGIGDALINVGVSGPGIINSKTIATLLIPTPRGKKGTKIFFDGLLGEARILNIPNSSLFDKFVTYGGQIPTPINSLKN